MKRNANDMRMTWNDAELSVFTELKRYMKFRIIGNNSGIRFYDYATKQRLVEFWTVERESEHIYTAWMDSEFIRVCNLDDIMFDFVKLYNGRCGCETELKSVEELTMFCTVIEMLLDTLGYQRISA